MRITALVKSREHVCCRYRVAAFRPCLEVLGDVVDIQPWSTGWFLTKVLPGFKQHLDVLVIQRKLFPAWQLKMLRARARRVVFDFDDSIFLHSSYNPLGQPCPKRFQQFRNMVQTADVVIAGNEFLHDQATALTDPDRVRLIPTCVETSRYPMARHDPSRDVVKLAWIGSASTLRGLERIRPLLECLGRSLPQVRFKIICDRSLSLEHLPVEFQPWNEVTETTELADADIGISWLPDDGWSAGKCGLKVLQYMAAGLPVVANPVGLQRTLVRDGESGYLVDGTQQWLDAVRRLAGDAELRRRMGRAGRRRVEADYDVTEGALRWRRLTEELGSQPRMRLPGSQ